MIVHFEMVNYCGNLPRRQVQQIKMLYTLILHNVVCQLYLNEAGKNNEVVNSMLREKSECEILSTKIKIFGLSTEYDLLV